jgi:hypothetical protein
VRIEMLVREGDKLYNVDEETGLVTEASEPEDDDLRIGDRVEVEGELGTVISITASLYGPAFGVRFDSGEVDEYPEPLLKSSSVEAPDRETPVKEVLSRFSSYEEMPVFTNDEISVKEREASWLNRRAKSLVTDSTLSLTEQNELGHVVLVTANDLLDLKERHTSTEESDRYVRQFNRYNISDEVGSGGVVLGMTRGDTSWLGGALEGMEVVETTDKDLAARAAEVVAAFSKEQLEDDNFMRLAASYHHEYLQLETDEAKKFDSYLVTAKKEKLRDLPEEKTASTDSDLDDIDPAAIFL